MHGKRVAALAVAAALLAGCTPKDHGTARPGPPAPAPLPSVVAARADPAPRTAAPLTTLAELPTELPGGKITDLSADGTAVGWEGRSDAAGIGVPIGAPLAPASGTARMVWWRDGVRHAVGPAPDVELPIPTLLGEPVISPNGLVGRPGGGWIYASQPDTGRGDARVDGPDVRNVVTLDVDDGGRTLIRLVPSNPMAKPWAHGWHDHLVAADGSVTPLGFDARFLLQDGSIVGTRLVEDGKPWSRPVLWQDGYASPLMTPSTVTVTTELRAATPGTIAGVLRAERPGGGFDATAAAWRDGEPVPLQSLGGDAGIAAAIGPDGTIAGTERTPSGDPHAVVWDAAGRLTDLGTLAGRDSWATGVAGSGGNRVVTGFSTDAEGVRRAVVWTAAGIAVLPADGAAQADGIVGSRVFGSVTHPGSDVSVPVVWTLSQTPG